MSKQLIVSDPNFKEDPTGIDRNFSLAVSEFFSETIQGEGASVGVPAAFLRLQGCTQNCVFCDSKAVWRYGNRYSFTKLFELMEGANLIQQLKSGTHLVLTGGSPLKQQKQLLNFIVAFITRYDFKPFIEIENEAVLMPDSKLISFIDQWNNSPKLENSKNSKKLRYQPEVLKFLSELENSWFKFVVTDEESWSEIKTDFIDTELVDKYQIILMPEGENREQLAKTRELTADIAIREGVRYSERQHIVLWDKKTGV